jgi:hypothetical protein
VRNAPVGLSSLVAVVAGGDAVVHLAEPRGSEALCGAVRGDGRPRASFRTHGCRLCLVAAHDGSYPPHLLDGPIAWINLRRIQVEDLPAVTVPA